MESASKSSGATSTLIWTSGASGRVNALFSLRMWRSLLVLINAVVLFLLLPFRCWKRAVVVNSCSPSSSSGEKMKDERSERKGPVVRVPAAIVSRRSSSSGGISMAATDQAVAARRALAIRRVMQDDDCNSSRDFSLFVTARGDTIFTQSWTPVSVKIRGLVVLLHGLNEHSGRYSDFAKELNANGFKVYGMDWIGHGGSDGLHSYVHSLDYAVSDMKSFLEKVVADNPGLPCFCFGHSTGGAIILKAVLDPKVEARVASVVLTSPAVGVQPSHPIFTVLAPIFSFLLPRYQIGAANKKGMPVSRDPEALVAKYSDPLVYTGSIRVRTGYEILRISSFLQQNLQRMRVPFLVLHGTADTVTDPEASQKLYEEASSTDKTIKLLDGFLHDILFEPEREEIMRDIIEWFRCRL
ncbi:monoglyceride lipase-like [Tripterygium wilfordii]|uniref:Monoglyceride lipase-like n=1 Tax=Tripterygium wilfordii TaxID=458696 RepID=A0A7J7CJ42_TRIWF|nr:monoacylglycerol lipase [Tripterygium wilfordii]KAF5734054.1 monoglyceride lipase-like [Tripterygium wilfordii]